MLTRRVVPPRPTSDRSRRSRACAPARAALVAVALFTSAPALGAPEARPPSAEHLPRDLARFEPLLAQQGEWVAARAGRAAWRPAAVDPGWQPYRQGSWTYTEDGWFWVSDEPWAVVTYHHGRWDFDGRYGWIWYPGRTWAPAWVAWRWDLEVVGWAPLPPDGRPAAAFWTFVPASRFVGERAEVAALPAARIPALLVQTRSSAGGTPRMVRRDAEAPPRVRRAGVGAG